jgi:hypothetical protein
MKRLVGKFMVAVAVAMAAALPVRGATLDDRVPAESVLYVGWSGAEALAPQYKNSNLKQIIDASSIRDFINKQLPALVNKAAENDPTAAEKIAKLQKGLDMAWRHPVAFYFCPVDWTNPRKPGVRFGLLCDAGADAKELNDLLTPLLQQVPPNADVQVKLSQEGGVTLLAFGKPDGLADLKAGGGLAGTAEYSKAMARVKLPSPAIAVYADVQKILKIVNDGLNAAPDAPVEVKTKVPAVIEALGLKGLTQAAMQGGFDGKGWREQAFVGITGPRSGVLTLMDDSPIPDSMLAIVPKEAASFSASHFDLQKLWGEARKVITVAEPRAIVDVDKAIARANTELGINIENDVVNAFGNEWVVYRAPVLEGGLTFALVNKARNGEALAKAIDTVEKLFNEKSGAPIKVEKVKTGGMEVSALMFMQYNVAWTVRNGYLYVSSLNGLAQAVKQVEAKGPSIVQNDQYKAVMASLMQLAGPGVKPSAISYAHPARIYPEVRTMVLGVLPLLRAQAHIDVPMDLLPDTMQVAEFMTPGGMITWSDADGVHGVGTSAFPGAALLAGQQPGGAAVAGVAGAAAVTGVVAAKRVEARAAHAEMLP